MKDRSFDPLAFLAGLAVAGAAVLAYDAFVLEPTSVEVTHHHLPLPDLPAAWEGARVVHLTDLHYGDPRSKMLHEWMVRTVNGLEPDLIVVTGDFAVSRGSEAKACAHYLAQLCAKH